MKDANMRTAQQLYDAGVEAFAELEGIIAEAASVAETPDQKAKVKSIAKTVAVAHKKVTDLAKEIPDVTIQFGGDGK